MTAEEKCHVRPEPVEAPTLAEFLRRCAEDCVNGASGTVYAQRHPKGLEEPEKGTACERCGAELRLVDPAFCGECER